MMDAQGGVPYTERLDSDAPYALVVDDNVWIRMDAAGILETFGFRCFEAGTGADGYRLLLEHHSAITLLFTDVNMPGNMDGFALARKAYAEWPYLLIVVASAVRKCGPGDLPDDPSRVTFIGKPFSADMIKFHLDKLFPGGKKPEPLKPT